MASNNHGRPERCLVTRAALENAAAALEAALARLDGEEVIQCAANAHYLRQLTKQVYRPRRHAVKGHRSVSKDLLLEAAGAIEDGAYEKEDAASYCNDEDSDTLISAGTSMRKVSNRLRRLAR